MFELDFFPKSAPKPPPEPLVPGLELSVPPAVLGDVDLLWGENASLSLPTGDALRLMFGVTSMVLACLREPESSEAAAEAVEFARVVPVGAVESIVSEVIRGEDSVR
jgi:hypothetical protein